MFEVLKTTFNYVIFGVINLRNFQRQWRRNKIRCPWPKDLCAFSPFVVKNGPCGKTLSDTILCLRTVEYWVYTKNNSLKATLNLCNEVSREMSLT